jgi:hypothetical protein
MRLAVCVILFIIYEKEKKTCITEPYPPPAIL